MQTYLLPNYSGIIILDEKSMDFHITGRATGSRLQHLALNIVDQQRAVLFSDYDSSLVRRMLTLGRAEILFEQQGRTILDTGAWACLYELKRPLTLFVDDENNCGLVYKALQD
jgi:hypothetical protein